MGTDFHMIAAFAYNSCKDFSHHTIAVATIIVKTNAEIYSRSISTNVVKI